MLVTLGFLLICTVWGKPFRRDHIFILSPAPPPDSIHMWIIGWISADRGIWGMTPNPLGDKLRGYAENGTICIGALVTSARPSISGVKRTTGNIPNRLWEVYGVVF